MVDVFDVEAFGAEYAYTLDGGGRGALDEVADEAAYDLVLLIHVIEHFNRPADSLRHIHRPRPAMGGA